MNTKTAFKNVQIINGFIIVGVLTFLIVVLYFIKDKSYTFNYNDQSGFTFIVSLFFVLGMFLGPFLFKKSINKATKESDLGNKLSKFQSATITRSALFEAPALMGLAATHFTSNTFYLIFVVLALFMLIYNFPTKDKFTQIFDLSFEEKEELDKI